MGKCAPFFFTIFVLHSLIHSIVQDQSISIASHPGYEFIPIDATHLPLSIFTTKNLLFCYDQCHKTFDCRTFVFDTNTSICRLWDVDTIATGSIVASPTKPQSTVGTIQFSPDIYKNIHNQSCDKCIASRYEICDTNTSRCRCPLKSFWNGSMCLPQLFRNQICSSADACRSELNLTCQPNCDLTYRCSDLPAIGVGQTVAGFCNASSGNSSSALNRPWGIYLSPCDGTLYVSNKGNKTFLAFPSFSRTGYIIKSNGLEYPTDIFVDSSNTIYMTDYMKNNGIVYIQRAGIDIRTIPPSGLSYSSCLPTVVYRAYGITGDRFGNAYISSYICCTVIKWPLNALSGVFIAGQPNNCSSTSRTLCNPSLIYLDEDRNVLYVAESGGSRIQKFLIGGNGTGITVAGNGTSGKGLNQLAFPRSVCVTRDGQTLYVADSFNNRVMKWTVGATQGSIVVGNVNGTAGNTSQLLDYPFDVALDPTETYLYVSDSDNNRVQRFRIR